MSIIIRKFIPLNEFIQELDYELDRAKNNSESLELQIIQSFFRNVSSLSFGMITDPPKKCWTDWSLKIFGEMGALDLERWEYPLEASTSAGFFLSATLIMTIGIS